jgi:hypothetical protein
MTPLSLALIETAARALADAEKRPLTERVVQEYRDDAQAVVVAVLARLGGKKDEPGLFSYASSPAQMILSIADEIDEGCPVKRQVA